AGLLARLQDDTERFSDILRTTESHLFAGRGAANLVDARSDRRLDVFAIVVVRKRLPARPTVAHGSSSSNQMFKIERPNHATTHILNNSDVRACARKSRRPYVYPHQTRDASAT